MTMSIHTPERIGIDDINLAASRKGLRITLTIPHVTGPISEADAAYWQDQIFFWNYSRVMLRDLKDLTRALRKLPESAHTDETRGLLERMKDLDTEAQA